MGARMHSDDDQTGDNSSLELERPLDAIFKISGEEGRRRYEKAKRRRQEQLQQIAFEHILEEAREDFEQTKNPLFVQIAIRYCDRRSAPFPKWVTEYLTNTADALIEMVEDPPRRVGVGLARALGFKTEGRGSPFSYFKNYRRREKMAISFARKVLDGEKPSEAVIQVAQEMGLSEAVVWKGLREFFGIPPKLGGRTHWKRLIEHLSQYPEFLMLLSKTDH